MHNDAFGQRAQADPAPYSVLSPRSVTPILLVCDHASNRVPARFADLGLERSSLEQHIGWDIGAAEVTRSLSRRLRATAVLSGASRLVIDCNRQLDDPTSVPIESDGIGVPGNRALTAEAKSERAERWFRPYHAAIGRQLDRLEQGGEIATMISIHSFTPEMNGRRRPWSIGILWDQDFRLAKPVMASLARLGYWVGDNEPYSGRGGGYTIDVHAAVHGRPHITFEIRQDLIASPRHAHRWGHLLAEVMRPWLGRSNPSNKMPG